MEWGVAVDSKSLGWGIFKQTAFWFLLPAILALVFVLIYPISYGISMSFTNRFFTYANYGYVGLQNFVTILHDPLFIKALANSLKFAVYVIVFDTLVGFGLALLLNSAGNYSRVFRILFFIPWILPSVVVAFAFRWLYNDTYGLINYLLLKWQLLETAVNPLARQELVWGGIILPEVWFSYAFVMLVFAAALKSINPNIYEAARIDGANRLQMFTNITLPALKSTFIMVTILQLVWEIASFDLIWLMTKGGPGNATLTLSLYIYKLAFDFKKTGYACAVATSMFLMLVVLIVCAFILLRYGDRYDEKA